MILSVLKQKQTKQTLQTYKHHKHTNKQYYFNSNTPKYITTNTKIIKIKIKHTGLLGFTNTLASIRN